MLSCARAPQRTAMPARNVAARCPALPCFALLCLHPAEHCCARARPADIALQRRRAALLCRARATPCAALPAPGRTMRRPRHALPWAALPWLCTAMTYIADTSVGVVPPGFARAMLSTHCPCAAKHRNAWAQPCRAPLCLGAARLCSADPCRSRRLAPQCIAHAGPCCACPSVALPMPVYCSALLIYAAARLCGAWLSPRQTSHRLALPHPRQAKLRTTSPKPR